MKSAFILPASVGMFTFVSACQQTDELSNPTHELHAIAITATIDPLSPTGRYVQNNEGEAAHFDTGDRIGVFMDEKPATVWNFADASWSTPTPMYWPDNSQPHQFYAYCPCPESATASKEAVPMPDLQSQSGRWQDVPQYDFLVATHQLSFLTNHGTVAFSGNEHSFKHVSTMVKIHIPATVEAQGITLNQLVLEGNRLFSPSTYSFASHQATVQQEPAVNFLSIHPQQKIEKSDLTYYLVVNGNSDPKQPATTLNLTLQYTASDGQTLFTATRKGISSPLVAGASYQFNVQMQGGTLIVTGGEISDWTPGNGSGVDLVVNGEEANRTKH